MVAVIFHVADPWAVALSATTWLGISVLVGWRAARWSPGRLECPGPVTRLRSWERDGSWWQEHFRVSHWKDRLPEAGAFFGGASKRKLRSRRSIDLARFKGEALRAERVHWLILASTPVHLIWCRPVVAAGMILFGVGFNAPFIVVQRFNRGRIHKLIARRSR